ncbi:biotin-(Acetyl-Coa carboxylase) ligase [Arthrobacter sp. Hiyo8]|nr:biotin-(Acetyl-Coa carboxylase) ligase [Arthrobacter sp. Hiyo8]
MDVEQPASSEPRAPRLGLDRDALLHPDFLAAAGISQLKIVETTGSTNADLLRAVTIEPKEWADLAVLTAEHQTAARAGSTVTGSLPNVRRFPFRSSCVP